jgi:hypothetical protein
MILIATETGNNVQNRVTSMADQPVVLSHKSEIRIRTT